MNRNKRCHYISSAVETPSQSAKQQTVLQNQERSQLGPSQEHAQDHLFYFEDERRSSLVENVPSRELQSSSPSDLTAAMTASNDQDQAAKGTSSIAQPSVHPHLQQQPQHGLLPGALSINLDPWPIETENAAQTVPGQLSEGGFVDIGINQEWFQRRMDMFGNAGSDSGDSASRWQRNGSWISSNSLISPDNQMAHDLDDGMGANAMSGISNDNLNFDLLGSLGILTQNPISPAIVAQQPSFSPIINTAASSTSSGMRVDPLIRSAPPNDHPPTSNNETASGLKETLHDAVESIIGKPPSTSASRRRFDVNERLHSCPFHKLNTDDSLVRIVRGYPSIMVRPGTYPPFVHHKLYRCSTGEIAEPLARAFCCIGAFYASVPTSQTFVHSMINEESQKLVKGFVSSCSLQS
jgi:hypothetical protein